MIPTTAQVLSFFNLMVGLMLTVSVLCFVGGFVMYLVRLGTWPTYRDEAVQLMMWGVGILFVLNVLLAIQQFLLAHLLVAVSVAATALLALIVWAVWQSLQEPAPPPPGERQR